MRKDRAAEAMRCRKCGQEIAIIQERLYRKIIVDAEAVRVVADPEGIDFVRIDGSKVRARIAPEDPAEINASASCSLTSRAPTEMVESFFFWIA